jgi:long-chain acyl-CoA synthetase
VREYAAPAITGPLTGNLTDVLVRHAHETPDRTLLRRRDSDGWTDVSAATFHDQVRAVAKGLVAAGIDPGDRVALLSRTRYEWTLVDYAIWYAGAITVPIYETSATEQISWILLDSGATAVVAETGSHVSRVAETRSGLTELRHVWSIEDNAIDVLMRLGADVADDELDERRRSRVESDLATLIYTSGTTGRPKGCMLSHGNFLAEVAAATEEVPELFADGASTLLFLPLAHVFARVIQVGCIATGTPLGHTADIPHLLEELQGFRPTFVLAVPRVFEKIFNTASQRATADGRGGVFARAAATAMAWSRGLDQRRMPLRVRAQHVVFDRLVYRRLREALGGSCRYAISGGAPLGERLGHFYRGIGLTVLEGYGLTETTAALTGNRVDAVRIGTVGQPLPGASVRTADDGELLFRGQQVFAGYWQDDAATQEAFTDDGWFRTGDVGEIDDEGYVRITGRKKEIIVTAGGKNVAPAVLEDRLRSHPLVEQCLVVGDGRPFIGALVTLDAEAVRVWAETQGKAGGVGELVDDPDLRAEIEAAVEDVNSAVSKAESIRKFRLLTDDWTEEGGQLTPSLKLRRSVVLREFKDEVAALYLT